MATYWHGGAPHLRRGDLILPPTRSGVRFTRAVQAIADGLDRVGQRGDRVYVTPDRSLAHAYAGGWSIDGVHYGFGWLYEVRVDPDAVEADADLLSLPGVSYQAPEATVARVVERGVRPGQRRDAEKLREVLERLERAKRSAGGGGPTR